MYDFKSLEYTHENTCCVKPGPPPSPPTTYQPDTPPPSPPTTHRPQAPPPTLGLGDEDSEGEVEMTESDVEWERSEHLRCNKMCPDALDGWSRAGLKLFDDEIRDKVAERLLLLKPSVAAQCLAAQLVCLALRW